MRFIFTLFLLVGIWSVTFGQDSLLIIADKELAQGEFQKAIAHYQIATDWYKKNTSKDKYIHSNIKLAECQLALGNPQKAVTQAEFSLNYCLSNDMTGTDLHAISLSTLGNSFLNMGRNDLALENLKKAADLFKAASLESAECSENLGVIYNNNGNKELALQYHEKALQIRKEVAQSDQVLIGDSYVNIGLIYIVDQAMQSMVYFNQALKIYQDNLGKSHPKLAYCYSNLAFANAQMGRFDEAIALLDKVESIWNATYDGNHPNKAYTLSNRGRIYEIKEDYDQALIQHDKALQMYLEIHGEKHPDIANTYFLIGKVYQKKRAFKLSTEYYQKSIYANLIDQQQTSIYDQPEIRDYFNADILLTSLQAKAKSMEALHFEKSLKKRDVVGAIDHYLLCDELITQIRHLRLNESDKLKLGQIAAEVYNNGIAISQYLSTNTFSKKKFLNIAFDFCERSKAAILLEAINETNAKEFGGVPKHEIDLEDSLKNEISFLEQQLAQTEDDTKTEQLKSLLFEYQNAERAFIQSLEKNYPEYYQLKYDQKLAHVNDIIEKLSPTTAVLSYFAGKEKVFVFLITSKKMELIAIPLIENFEKQIYGLRNAIKFQIPQSIQTISSSLYAQLIPKVPSDISEVIIIPDGVMSTIPFEVLSNGSENAYFIEKYAVSYDYSATLLKSRIATGKKENIDGILLAAPINFEVHNAKMPNLPASKDEIREIKFLFSGQGHETTLELEKGASEGLMKSKDVSNFQYIHLATHGVVNESQPELSRIFLSPSEGEDGSLYSGEIYNLKLNADLITLSACETGLGKIAKGEGVVGLSRALMYAGAENLIVSLWQVSDASTSQLMIEFYKEHLYHSKNHIFADDLRKAKLSLIKSDNYQSPYYWAPFILVGK